MKSALSSIVFVIISLAAATVLAESSSTQMVNNVRQMNDGNVLISLEGGTANGCGGDLIKVTNPAATQGALKLALAAFLSGKKIQGISGTCEGDELVNPNIRIWH